MKKWINPRDRPKSSTVHPSKSKSSLSIAGYVPETGGRLLSLDAVRGLLMILMAIDHANYFIAHKHPVGPFWSMPMPQYKSMLGFLTRFVTHPCAAGFFFLMGVGMILFAESRRHLGWTEGKIMRHFISRGFLLIILQQFLEDPAWLLGPTYTVKAPGGGETVWFHFGVLYALGAAMIIAALLLRFASAMLMSLSLIIVIVPQFLIPEPSKSDYLYSPLLRLILIPGQTGIMQVFYSVLPWLGLAGFGLVFGKWILQGYSRAYRRALIVGMAFVILFFVVRIGGGFGNIHPPDGSGWIGFLNVTKYPPSIAFLLLTLGANLLFLVLFSHSGAGLERWGKPLLVFGRTALFFYIVHLYLYALIGLAVAGEKGTGFPMMYLLWFAGLVFLYPICRWYGNFKKGKSADSIWRLF